MILENIFWALAALAAAITVVTPAIIVANAISKMRAEIALLTYRIRQIEIHLQIDPEDNETTAHPH